MWNQSQNNGKLPKRLAVPAGPYAVGLNLIPSFGVWTRSCFGAEITLGRLNRRVAKEQLGLLKLATGGAAQLRARVVQVMGLDFGHPALCIIQNKA